MSKAAFSRTRSTYQARFLPILRERSSEIAFASRSNVDIGLMQINWGYWGRRFGLTKTDLLDPGLNVLLGARILEYCVRVSGSWRKGVALYHSPHEARQRDYVEKVRQSYRRVLVKLGK